MSSDNQSGVIDDSCLCDTCQHSVDVVGIEQVVCLAYLSVRDPMADDACNEFEHKRRKPLAPATA